MLAIREGIKVRDLAHLGVGTETHQSQLPVPQMISLNEDQVSHVGKISFCLNTWQKYTDDPCILQTVAGYCIEFEKKPFQANIPNEIKLSEEQKKCVDIEIQELLKKGAIVQSEWEQNQFISNIFIVPKPNGRFIPIINLKYLNYFVSYEHFKQETFKTVLELVQEKDYFTNIDMQDAYFSVSVEQFFCRYLKIIWNGNLYAFVCVPFGLSSAPRLFTKLLKPIFAWFRQQAIRCSYYIDDSLYMDGKKDVCSKNTSMIVQTLESLGFTINEKKSVLIPTQKIVFFGFFIDSLKCMVFLTEEQIVKIFSLARYLLGKEIIFCQTIGIIHWSSNKCILCHF